MNILILCTHLNPAGISRYVINLSKGLMRRGHTVYVGCAGGEWITELTALGIPYRRIPIKTKSIVSVKIIQSLFSLAPFLRQQKIQIVHANTRVTQYLSYLIYKFLHIPYVSTFHCFHQPTFFRKLFKFAGVATIAVSEAVKKHLTHDLKIQEAKIRRVYNGIDYKEIAKRKKQKSDYGLKEYSFTIGILGRISQEKGHLLAAQTFKLLFPKYDNIYMLVSGRGRLETELKLFLRLCELEERVRFLNLDASDFLDITDLLLVPSAKEGFGYAIIEAFAKGVPVIGFNTGGISEIIKDRENGLLFYKYEAQALKEAIEELIYNSQLRQKVIENAKNNLDVFSLEEMAANTEKVYGEIIK